MFYGGFGSLSYSASEEPSNIDLEASKCSLCYYSTLFKSVWHLYMQLVKKHSVCYYQD